MTDTSTFDINDAPMERDRSLGWRFVRAGGDVFQASDGQWFLTSTEAVDFAHRHPEIFSSAKAFDGLGSPVPLIPIAIDPPDHKRFRKVLDPMLAPRVVNAIEGSLRAQVRELIATFAGRGSCEAVDELARLYPTQVFLTLFGLPLEDRDRFIHWAEAIIEATAAGAVSDGAELPPEVMENAMALFVYLQACVDQKREEPGDDMLSRVLQLADEEAFSNEEVLGLCFLFVLAGLDTVTAMIGFTLLHLARDADLRRRLRDDPALVGPVIEEVLRLEQPAPLTPRVTVEAVELGGQVIPAGARVMLVLGTINRDGARFAHPDTINPAQADLGHKAFGGGIHRCLGSHLARRELRLVVEEFLAAIPDFEVAAGAEPEIVWPSGTLHLRELRLVFPPAYRTGSSVTTGVGPGPAPAS
jgi:cytochrome P450